MTFPEFVARELGPFDQQAQFWRNLFLRPFCAPSFHGFWRDWNPAYRYILWYGVYRPSRRFLSPAETYNYGEFVHVMDIEGNKVELWEPNDIEYDKFVGGRTK